MKQTPLEYGHFYHIYNRGINSCKLFRETTNYEHFLGLYDQHISPVADTFAWVLMENHFHLLVKIKDKQATPDLQGFPNLEGLKNRNRVNQQFANFFNAYSKAFNRKYDRKGSLFEHPFSRIKITSNAQLKYLAYCIHQKPIHHGFCEDMLEYPWSSYLTILSQKKTRLKRDEVLNWYKQNIDFKKFHQQQSINKFSKLHIDSPY